jgi:hypothetical protein
MAMKNVLYVKSFTLEEYFQKSFVVGKTNPDRQDASSAKDLIAGDAVENHLWE